MIETQLICEICGKPITDTVHEMTDELGVTVQMCDKCFFGLVEAYLIGPNDHVVEKTVAEVLSNGHAS